MDYTDNAVTSAAQNSFKIAICSAGRPSESTACIHAIFFSGTHLSGLPQGKHSQLTQRHHGARVKETRQVCHHLTFYGMPVFAVILARASVAQNVFAGSARAEILTILSTGCEGARATLHAQVTSETNRGDNHVLACIKCEEFGRRATLQRPFGRIGHR